MIDPVYLFQYRIRKGGYAEWKPLASDECTMEEAAKEARLLAKRRQEVVRLDRYDDVFQQWEWLALYYPDDTRYVDSSRFEVYDAESDRWVNLIQAPKNQQISDQVSNQVTKQSIMNTEISIAKREVYTSAAEPDTILYEIRVDQGDYSQDIQLETAAEVILLRDALDAFIHARRLASIDPEE